MIYAKVVKYYIEKVNIVQTCHILEQYGMFEGHNNVSMDSKLI